MKMSTVWRWISHNPEKPGCYWPMARRVPRSPLIGCSLLLWYQTSDAEVSCPTSVLVQQEVVARMESDVWVSREEEISAQLDWLMSVTHSHLLTPIECTCVCVCVCEREREREREPIESSPLTCDRFIYCYETTAILSSVKIMEWKKGTVRE